jgi:carboxyl-terminal processing protease
MIIGRFAHAAQLIEDIPRASANVRWSTAMTTTHAGRCRMSVQTARIRPADFDAALERYRNAPGLIVDVRMNPGGNDSLAFEVAGRFARTAVVFGHVQFRNGPMHTDFGPTTTRTLNPRGSWQYAGHVLLLIGRRCASSNESFIAAMGQLSNVTLVGDRTAGSTGNPGTFPLANGWAYTVSRWIEYSADHQPIEDMGLSPDVFVTTGAEDFGMGRDPVLEWALKATPR